MHSLSVARGLRFVQDDKLFKSCLSVLGYRRVFRRVIELRQKLNRRVIFPLPRYRSPDRLIDRNRLLVPQFLTDAR